MANDDRFRAAMERFDAANRKDPNRENDLGKEHPKELLYSQRMTRCLRHFAPEASESVQLAAHAQHICRWRIPRDNYPKGRQGYRQWRTDLGKFHAETTGAIMDKVSYEQPEIERVQSLLCKQRLKADPECQLLEDVACLVFLQYYLAEFAQQHDEAKLINILQRTWRKMSDRGHRSALALPLPPPLRGLVEQAVGGL